MLKEKYNMKINVVDAFKELQELGYLDDSYCIDLDPSLTYQEFLLINFLRTGGSACLEFDPDEIFNFVDDSIDKIVYDKLWDENYVASKTNGKIINKPWNEVLVNKKNIKLDKNNRK